jgi:ABC-type multidrug transport system permease subunit
MFVYYFCGLRNSGTNTHSVNSSQETGGGGFLLYFYFMIIHTDVAATLFFMTISNISSSLMAAANLTPILLFLQVVTFGYLIYLPKLPTWLSWLSYLSLLRYGFQGLVINELYENSGNLPLESEYIHKLGFESFNRGDIVILFWTVIMVMAALSYYTLHYIRHERV